MPQLNASRVLEAARAAAPVWAGRALAAWLGGDSGRIARTAPPPIFVHAAFQFASGLVNQVRPLAGAVDRPNPSMALRDAAEPAMKILVIDIGGSHVKMSMSADGEALRFDSGPGMTPTEMIGALKPPTADWAYDAITIGYPGVVKHNRIVTEPMNLGPGWVGFDFERALGRPTRIINDAAMQALGLYCGGKMLFLGLGTGLGSAMVIDGTLLPMELAHLPYRKDRSFEDYVGAKGLHRLGDDKWKKHVWRVVDLLRRALEPDEVVIGGGNAKRLQSPPDGVRIGLNASAFLGGLRVWQPNLGLPAPVP